MQMAEMKIYQYSRHEACLLVAKAWLFFAAIFIVCYLIPGNAFFVRACEAGRGEEEEEPTFEACMVI
jgi:hypothetical protein